MTKISGEEGDRAACVGERRREEDGHDAFLVGFYASALFFLTPYNCADNMALVKKVRSTLFIKSDCSRGYKESWKHGLCFER